MSDHFIFRVIEEKTKEKKIVILIIIKNKSQYKKNPKIRINY